MSDLHAADKTTVTKHSTDGMKRKNFEKNAPPPSAKKIVAVTDRKKRKLQQEEIRRTQRKIDGFFEKVAP